jgi:hypothetical protein
MDDLTHFEWQLTKLLLAGSGVLFTASLFLYLLLRPFIAREDKDERPTR